MSGAGLPADPAFFMKRLREQGHIHCFASKSFIQREAKWGQGALPLAGFRGGLRLSYQVQHLKKK